MIFLFQTRYSGWPCGGEWVACVERHDVEWTQPYLEGLIDTCCSPGDCDAANASDEIRRRCLLAGGDTAQDALMNLIAHPDAANLIRDFG